jgi:hypothetical protein
VLPKSGLEILKLIHVLVLDFIFSIILPKSVFAIKDLLQCPFILGFSVPSAADDGLNYSF